MDKEERAKKALYDFANEVSAAVKKFQAAASEQEPPKLKPADMSVFVGQPVLFEFWDFKRTGFACMGLLASIHIAHRRFKSYHGVSWQKAQPKFDYWQSIKNITCPFDEFFSAIDGAGFKFEIAHCSFRITGYRDGFGPEWEGEQ